VDCGVPRGQALQNASWRLTRSRPWRGSEPERGREGAGRSNDMFCWKDDGAIGAFVYGARRHDAALAALCEMSRHGKFSTFSHFTMKPKRGRVSPQAINELKPTIEMIGILKMSANLMWVTGRPEPNYQAISPSPFLPSQQFRFAQAARQAKRENKSCAGHFSTALAARCSAGSMAPSESALSSERKLNSAAQLNPSERRTSHVLVPGRLPLCQ
jgi:hypothetical protein